MGTTYTVKINEPGQTMARAELHTGISAILDAVNDSMSTYIENSELSGLNRAPDGAWLPLSADLYTVIGEALEISELTSGSFDISIGPVVNLWGFGPQQEKRRVPQDIEIDSALAASGFRHLHLRASPPALLKDIAGIYLDLSGIAKGFAVDKIAHYLEQHNIDNYLVEIGGEIRAAGVNEIGFAWRIGIEQPVNDRRAVQRIIKLDNIAMATSGDYRNFFEADGKRYSHTIDPGTGRPVNHDLVSVTVLHPRASRADALATAFLVMGADAARTLAERENVAVLFLQKNENGFTERYTSAFRTFLLDEESG